MRIMLSCDQHTFEPSGHDHSPTPPDLRPPGSKAGRPWGFEGGYPHGGERAVSPAKQPSRFLYPCHRGPDVSKLDASLAGLTPSREAEAPR